MALSGMHVRKVACGSGHTVATTAAGQVYVWGVGQNGVLGCGGAADDGAPTAWDLPRQLSQQQRRASTPPWEIHCGDVYFDVVLTHFNVETDFILPNSKFDGDDPILHKGVVHIK